MIVKGIFDRFNVVLVHSFFQKKSNCCKYVLIVFFYLEIQKKIYDIINNSIFYFLFTFSFGRLFPMNMASIQMVIIMVIQIYSWNALTFITMR